MTFTNPHPNRQVLSHVHPRDALEQRAEGRSEGGFFGNRLPQSLWIIRTFPIQVAIYTCIQEFFWPHPDVHPFLPKFDWQSVLFSRPGVMNWSFQRILEIRAYQSWQFLVSKLGILPLVPSLSNCRYFNISICLLILLILLTFPN